MVGWFSRVTWLINHTNEILEMRVSTIFDPNGEYCDPILLQPHECRKIPATKFYDQTQVSGIFRTIHLRRNGILERNFSIFDFRDNEQFIFSINDEGGLDVDQVLTEGVMNQIYRLGLVACFRRP